MRRVDLAAARPQVPPPPGSRRQAPAPHRARLLPGEGRQGVLRPGPPRQAEHDQAAPLDRSVTLRPGQRPAAGLPDRPVARTASPPGTLEPGHDGTRLRSFVDDSITDDSLKDALEPPDLFKFLHRLIEEHCHRHTEDQPRWTVDHDTFRTAFALGHMRDLEAFDRGYGHG